MRKNNGPDTQSNKSNINNSSRTNNNNKSKSHKNECKTSTDLQQIT